MVDLTRRERGAIRPRPNLERTLFRPTITPPLPGHLSGEARVERAEILVLEQRVRALEAALLSLSRGGSASAAEATARLAHLQLVCEPTGYSIIELDEPPPLAGAVLRNDRGSFEVSRLVRSPFPDDARRCAILTPLATISTALSGDRERDLTH